MPQRITLTKAAIAAIPAPEQGTRAVVYDTKVPKLAVRVTAAGTQTFYVVKRTPSGMEWVSLGLCADMTIEQARKAAAKTLGRFADGENPAETKRKKRAQMKLGAAFEDYMTRHVEAKGIKRGADLRQMWERCLGDLPDGPKKKHAPRERSKHPGGVNWQQRGISTISRDDIAALHVAIGKTTPILANRVIELLSAVYNKLRDWGVGIDNPAHGIEPFKEHKRDRFLQRGELPRFFAALEADSSEDFREFVLLSLLTGARRGNVLALRWADVDVERAVWRIPASAAKGGETIDVPLVAEALAIIETRRERMADGEITQEFVFPAASATGYMTPPKKRWAALFQRAELDELRNRLKAAGKPFPWKDDGSESLERAVIRARAVAKKTRVDARGARLDDLRIHDLRRSLGSWQAILGASLPIVGKSLGHKSASATMIYARLDHDAVRESVERATSAMLVAGGIKKPATMAKLSGRKAKR